MNELKFEELEFVTGGDQASVTTQVFTTTPKGDLNVTTKTVYTSAGSYTTTTAHWVPY